MELINWYNVTPGDDKTLPRKNQRVLIETYYAKKTTLGEYVLFRGFARRIQPHLFEYLLYPGHYVYAWKVKRWADAQQ